MSIKYMGDRLTGHVGIYIYNTHRSVVLKFATA